MNKDLQKRVFLFLAPFFVVILSIFAGSKMVQLTQDQQQVTERILEAPVGTCVVMNEQPSQRMHGILRRTPEGEIFFQVNTGGIRTLRNPTLINEMYEPGPNAEQEVQWVNCLKQFALIQ